MAEAFRRENVDPNFDWATYYGQGVSSLVHARAGEQGTGFCV